MNAQKEYPGNRKLAVVAVAVLALLCAAQAAHAQQPESCDRTLAPYFFVKSEDSAVDRLPLKSTSAAVRIAGVIADVTVAQVYMNEGKRTLEAIYVFPGSTRAAVYAMTMKVGTRTIEAVIKERQQARADYEQARSQGRTASLLEQQRPNVFQMNVANILPGDEVNVTLRYTELLVPTEGVYEFVYPTVVGPRYSNRPAAGAADTERWVSNPYHHQGEAPSYTFDIKATLSAGMPIQRVACPSHRTSVAFDGSSVATVTLDPSETYGGNRDFVLKYALGGSAVQTGLLLWQGKDENFFLLMAQPPGHVSAEQIPPRDYVFIVDVSGSMHGYPLEVSKKLLADLIGHLRSTDSFNVLLFSGGSAAMAERPLPATPENVRRAIALIESQQGGGATELVPALRRALALPRMEGASRTVVIATDGYVDVEKDAFELIRGSLDRSNVFAFGIGTAVNRFLIEGIARAGMGEPFVVTKPEEAEARAEKFRKYVQSPVLTQVRVDLGALGAYDVEPPTVPDVLAERPVIVFGKWRGHPSGRVTVRGETGGGAYARSIDVGGVKPLEANSALRYLWARHRIAALGDYNTLHRDGDTVKEITRLGLAYNLLTEFTSFVAVDTVVRAADGKVETVMQPLPLPQGVSDLAVGGQAKIAMVAPARGSAGAVGGMADGVVGGVEGGVPGGVAAGPPVAEQIVVQGNAPLLVASQATATDAASNVEKEDKSKDELRTAWAGLRRTVRGWRFPSSSGSSTVTVTLRRLHGAPSVVGVISAGSLSSVDAERFVKAALAQQKSDLEQGVPAGVKVVMTIAVRPDGTVDRVEFSVNQR